MISRILELMIALLVAGYVCAYAGGGLVDVKNYSGITGERLNRIQNMLQDEDGFIWIATWNGLEKFDGYSFTNYKSYPTDENRLQTNRIQNIAIASTKSIWVETYDHRIYIFDIMSEKFIDIFSARPDIQPCREFESIHYLEGGVIWLSDNSGTIWRINGDTYSAENGIEIFIDFVSKGKSKIYGVYADGTGGEWILTDKGFRVYGKPGLSGMRRFVRALRVGNRLALFDDKGSLVVYDQTTGLADARIEVPLADCYAAIAISDNVCVLPSQTGLLIYDLDKKQARNIEINELKDQPVYSLYQTKSPLQKNYLWMLVGKDAFRVNISDCSVKKYSVDDEASGQSLCFIHEDSSGELWMLPFEKPLSHYDRENDSLERAYYYSGGKKSGTPAIVLTYLVDNHKNLWGRADMGLNKITFPYDKTDYLSFSNYETRSVTVDHSGKIWTGDRNNEVSIYGSQGTLLGKLNPLSGCIESSPKEKFPSTVYAIMEDSKGRIWIGTRYDGIYLAMPSGTNTYSIRRFTVNDEVSGSLNANKIYSFHEDRNGRIWIGTYGGGINLVDEKTGDIRFLNSNNGGLNYFFNGTKCRFVRHIAGTRDGIIMVGTTDGLVTFSDDFDNPAEIRFYRNWCDVARKATLSNNDVFFSFEDSRGHIYVATHGGGINRVKSRKLLSDRLEFSYIGKKEGLPSDMVYALAEDKKGKIWISLENAICCYSTGDGKIDTYDRHTFHLPLISSEAPFVISPEGTAYFPTLNGTLRTDLRTLRKSDFKPNIVFERAIITVDKDSTKTVALNGRALHLKADERNLTISFAALDFDNTENISYAYRIDGSDKWIELGHNHETSFYGIQAGDHLLEVKSTNGDGVWIENTAVLPIHVQPTFMETIWARLLWILLIAGGVAGICLVVIVIMRLRRQVSVEQELTKLKLRFFTDISHELRTPLTLIVNPIDELSGETHLSAKGREYLAIAKSNSQRMLRLINQLLDIRKIQNGKMKIYVELIDVVTIFHRIYDDFSAIAAQKGIKFSLNMPMRESAIYTDEDKLEKIVFNLLSNAFKYTPEKGEVMLQVEQKERKLTFSVSDNGTGIDKKQVGSLFNRFETFGRKRGVDSSGIGLSLVDELVKVLHGKIEVESTLGAGSRFTVTLDGDIDAFRSDPEAEFILGDRYEGLVSTDSAADSSEADVLTDKEDISILIVEDNAELRSLMRKMLGERYKVATAQDGVDAWEKLMEDMPDMIISDIMMPCMDGLELLAKIRENGDYSHIPVILLSAKAAISDRIEGIECGADDYITKPFSASYLRSRIKSLFEQRSRLREFFLRHGTSAVQSLSKEKLQPQLPSLTRFDENFIAELKTLISEEIGNADFSIDEMAERMKTGRTMFNKKVRSLFNMAPVELLKQMRISRAKELLMEGEKTVAEISYACGFSSPQYFNRVFKVATGQTPNEWRFSRH